MKQIIANFLRKLIKLDNYIEDRVFTEINNLDKELQECIDEVNGMGIDMDDKPNFYDMESYTDSQVEDNYNILQDKIDNLETKLEELDGKIES